MRAYYPLVMYPCAPLLLKQDSLSPIQIEASGRKRPYADLVVSLLTRQRSFDSELKVATNARTLSRPHSPLQ